MPTHLIKRQVLEISVPDKSEARKYQDAFAKIFHEEIKPVLEQVLDQYDPGGRVQVDTLEMNLGALEWPPTRKALRWKVEEILAGALRDRSLTSASTPGDHKPALVGPGESSSRPEMRSAFDDLIFYLYTGRMNWNAPSELKISELAVLIFEDLLGLESILQAFAHDSTGWKRMMAVLPKKSINEITRISLSTQYTSVQIQKKLWKILEQLSANAPVLVAKKDLGALLFHEACQSYLRQISGAENHQSLHFALMSVIDAVVSKAVRPAKDLIPLVVESVSQVFELSPEEVYKATNSWNLLIETPESSNGNTPYVAVKTAPPVNNAADGMLVKNGGAILLWPYLSPFFQEYDLIKNGKFADEQNAGYAACIIHWLCTGREPEDESDLTLPKILCGLAPEAYVDFTVKLEKRIQAEGIELLENVIKNWPALKKTSIEGLRKTFLQRPGVLVQDDHGWRLNVEQQTIDILLQRLTWPISIIKLPWNDFLIHVEWV